MSAPYRQVDVHKIPMAGPADVSGLVKLMDEGTLDPGTIVAILGTAFRYMNVVFPRRSWPWSSSRSAARTRSHSRT